MALSNSDVSYATFLSLSPSNSTGSGFMLSIEKKEFLITAKHVLFDGNNLRSESLLITMQSHLGDPEDAKTLVIDQLSTAKVFLTTSSDIVAIEIDENFRVEAQGKNINSISINDLDIIENIAIANNILLVGFPTSLILRETKFFDINRPLLRKGIVAGINIKENTFIIDCPVFYGNSGGPVIEYKGDGNMKLIGIVSKYIPFVIEWKNNREAAFSRQEFSNSGYAICIPLNEIIRLISV